MRNVLLRLSAATLMEVILAFVSAPFYMQIFPVALLVWSIVDMALNVKTVRIETQVVLPKAMKKKIEKIAKKQAQELEEQLKNQVKKNEPKDD